MTLCEVSQCVPARNCVHKFNAYRSRALRKTVPLAGLNSLTGREKYKAKLLDKVRAAAA
jgi:hypothetical protein